MVFAADDFVAWLFETLADAGRKKLVELVLGTDQQRALRQAAVVAIREAVAELCPDDAGRAGELAMVVSHVFREPVAVGSPAGHQSLLEAIWAGIAAQFAVLDDASLTGTGQSSSEVLGVPGAVVATALTSHLLCEIMTRGAQGGPLFPLACQLNNDESHIRGLRLETMLGAVLDRLGPPAAPGAALAASAILDQLPPQPTGFTGRDDDLAVLAGLLDPRGPARTVLVSAVAGLAGVGKTSLAVAAGRAAVKRGWFPGGALFIDLHGYDETPAEPGQALDALLRALGAPAESIPPGTEQRAGLYRSLLAQAAGPVLLVADNASCEAQVTPLLPGGGPHKVLITSRHILAGLGARLVDVAVLDDDTAVRLLDAALRAARPGDDRISGDPDAALRLARACGGLPLALRITAALLIADPPLTAAELAKSLAEESQRLEQLAYDDGSGEGKSSVAAAFKLSYRKLDEIAARVFRFLPASPGPDTSTTAVAALAALTVAEARRVLGGLARAHLIGAVPGEAGRWRMHDLVRLYAKRLSDTCAHADGREDACDRLLGYYLDTARAANERWETPSWAAVPGRFTSRADALAWLDAERASLVAAVNMAGDTGRDRAAHELSQALAVYLGQCRRFDDRLAVASIGLNAARRLGDPTSEGNALTTLGSALGSARRFGEAISAHQAAATIYHQTGDERMLAGALGNLGAALHEADRFDEAIGFYQGAIAIFRAADDIHGAAMTINNLGTSLREMGHVDEAIAAHEAAAEIYQATGDERREAGALANLGIALGAAGRLDEAITLHHRAATVYRVAGDHHGEGMTLNNLALVLDAIGQADEAGTAFQDAAAIFQDARDDHGEAKAVTNLGLTMEQAGRFGQACAAHQHAATIYSDTGDQHGEAMAMRNLGKALLRAGQFDEAITALRRATSLYRRVGNREGEGAVLNNLGLALQQTGQFDDACVTFRHAATIFGDTSDQRGQAMATGNLGTALQQTGRFAEAVIACRDAASIFHGTGDRHDEAGALTNLGLSLRGATRFSEAVVTCQDAVTIFRDIGDSRGEGVALVFLAVALHEAGRPDEAIATCQDALPILRQARGQ